MWRRIIFSLFAAASLYAGIHFSFVVTEPSYAMTGVWLTFSLFVFALGWPELAESISFLGSSIKLREVKAAIDELRSLAEVNSKAILDLVQGSSRWGGIPEDEKKTWYERVETLMRELGIKEDRIKAAQSRWHYYVEIDYIHNILGSNINHPAIPKENLQVWYERRREITDARDLITPDQLRRVFREVDGYTQTVQTVIDDFEYYKKNLKHRDFDRWKSHANWFKNQDSRV